MKYQKALAALHEYIANFNPEEFSSSPDFRPINLLSAEQLANVQKIKDRLKKKRLLIESLHALRHPHISEETEVIITQEEVDALLKEWIDPRSA